MENDPKSSRNRTVVRLSKSNDDPLYLHNSDHLGMILVTDPLTEKNYLQWKIAMETALGAKLKLGFIHRTILSPSESHKPFNQWICVDRMVRLWILNVISNDIVKGFCYTSTAHQLWIYLQEQFRDYNGPMLYKVQREICSMTQGSLSVTLYYTALKKLWHEYRMLEPIPVCSCGASRHIAELETRHQLIQFLMGLHDSYDSIRDQILLIDPIPSVAKAYSMVLQVEEQHDNNIHFTDLLEQSANLTRVGGFKYSAVSNKPNKEGDKGHKYCTYCKESSHAKEQCFKLIGYPDWWKEKRRGQLKSMNVKNNTQFAVNAMDHPLEWSDFEGKPDSRMVGLSTDMSVLIQREVVKYLKHNSSSGNVAGSSSGSGQPQQQHVNFVHTGEFTDIFSDLSCFSLCDCWILNTRTTSHLRCDRSLFDTLNLLANPISLFLPDG